MRDAMTYYTHLHIIIIIIIIIIIPYSLLTPTVCLPPNHPPETVRAKTRYQLEKLHVNSLLSVTGTPTRATVSTYIVGVRDFGTGEEIRLRNNSIAIKFLRYDIIFSRVSLM